VFYSVIEIAYAFQNTLNWTICPIRYVHVIVLHVPEVGKELLTLAVHPSSPPVFVAFLLLLL
jgi:hypothetical protein